MSRAASYALPVLFALIPLYGTFAALDPARPPIPPLVPTAATMAIALVLIASLIAVVPAAVRAGGRDWLTFAFLAPGIATFAAALTGFDPVLGIGLGLGVTGVGAAGLVVARGIDALTVHRCLRAFLWSAVAACAVALAMWLAHKPAALYAYNNGRAVGTFLNPNELAAYALIALGVAVPLAVGSRGRDRLATVCALALLITLGATFSRWGALSAVCGLAVYAVAARARALFGAAIAVGVLGIALNAAAGDLHHNVRDTEARVVAWRTGLTTFARFPLLGVGPLAFPHTYVVLRPPEAPGPHTPVAFDPHSLPIAFAADGGIVALVTLTVSFTIVLRRVLVSSRRAAPLPRALGFGLAAALVALFIHSGINTISLFFPLGLQVVPIALAAIRTDALAE